MRRTEFIWRRSGSKGASRRTEGGGFQVSHGGPVLSHLRRVVFVLVRLTASIVEALVRQCLGIAAEGPHVSTFMSSQSNSREHRIASHTYSRRIAFTTAREKGAEVGGELIVPYALLAVAANIQPRPSNVCLIPFDHRPQTIPTPLGDPRSHPAR